jgi:hypothetical protein
VDPGLVLQAVPAVWAMPETVHLPRARPRVRIRPPDVPPQVRSAFLRAATAGCAVLGMFTASALGQITVALGSGAAPWRPGASR